LLRVELPTPPVAVLTGVALLKEIFIFGVVDFYDFFHLFVDLRGDLVMRGSKGSLFLF
jgi:hypothetical protein